MTENFLLNSGLTQCTFCPKTFKNKSYLSFHMTKKHRQPKKLSPSYPKTTSSSSPTLKFQCPFCQLTYTRTTDVNLHVNKKHREEVRALNWEKCPECDTLCPTTHYLKKHIAVAHSVRRQEKKAQKLNLSRKAESEETSTTEVESPRAEESACQDLAKYKSSNPKKLEIGSHSREVELNRPNAAMKEASPKVISIRKKNHTMADVIRSDKRNLPLKSFTADKRLIKSNESILLKQGQDKSACLNSSDSDDQTSTPNSTGSLKLSFRWDREQNNWTINKSNNKDAKIHLSFDSEENDAERQIEALQKQSETLRKQIDLINTSINMGNERRRKSALTPKVNKKNENSNNKTASTATEYSSVDEEDEIKMFYDLDPALHLSFEEEDCEDHLSQPEVITDESDYDEEEMGESNEVEEISLLTDDEEEMVTSLKISRKRQCSVVMGSIPKRNRTYVATNVTFDRSKSRPSFARLSLERNQSFNTTASLNNNRKAFFRQEVIEIAPTTYFEPQTTIDPFDLGHIEMLRMRRKSSSLKSQKIVTKPFKTQKLSEEGNSREFFGLGPRDSIVIVEDNYELAENNFPVVGPYMCEICRTFVKTNREFVRHVQENHHNELDKDILLFMQSQLTI